MNDYVIVKRDDLGELIKDLTDGRLSGMMGAGTKAKEILANAPPAEGREPYGYMDEFGNFEKELRPWMEDEMDMSSTEWFPVYTAPADTEQPGDGMGGERPLGQPGPVWGEQPITAQDESAKLRQISNALNINAFQKGELTLFARMLEDTAHYIEHTEAKYQCAIEGTDYYEGYEEGLKAAKQDQGNIVKAELFNAAAELREKANSMNNRVVAVGLVFSAQKLEAKARQQDKEE